MTWILDASLRFRRLILAVAAGVLVVGVIQVGNTSTEALPEFNPPMVEVQTEALGLSAEEVEQLITVPLEQDLLAGVPFLDRIDSTSMPGLSSVVMIFEPGTDLLDARQVVQERLTQAVGVAGLPDVSKPPQMIQPLSSSSRVAMMKLSSQNLTPIEVSVLARWVIGPRLMSVPGVANVVTWGNRERQLQVQVDPARLAENDTTLAQVVKTAGNALEVSPLSFLEASTPGTGGFIDTPNQRLNIFHEQAIKTSDELAQVPLEGSGGGGSGGAPATLGDVTDVVEDHQPLIGDTVCGGGEDCLLLVVEKFPGANTVEVTEGVEDAIAALQPGLAGVEFDSSTYRPASFVESSFSNLAWALLAGGILLLVALFALFWDWRRWLTSVLAIAVSFAAAVIVLQLRDTTVDLMVAAGLVVGLTVVVHDAVVDVDGVARWLRRRESNGHRPAWQVVVESMAEVRSSIVYASLVVAAATLPLFFLGGEGGAFLPPVALSYLLAVAASMLVAITVTPALSLVLLAKAAAGRSGAPLGRQTRRRYDRVAPRFVTRTPVAAGIGLGVLVLGLAMTPFLDASLRPSLDERDVLVHLEAAPGTSLPKMTAITDELVQEVGSLSGVDNVGSHVGRAVMADEVVDVNSGEVWVHLASDADYDDTVASIEEAVGARDDVTSDVGTYTEERVVDVLGGSAEDEVTVRAYGVDPETLDGLAGDLQSVVADVDGVSEATVDRAPVEDAMQVEVNLEQAQAFGLKPGDVRRAAASLLGGITVGNLFDDQKVFDVVVWGEPSIRNSEGDVEQLLIDTPQGDQVRLGAVADVRIVDSPTMIRHEAISPYLDVVAQVPGGDVGAVQDELADVVSGLEAPREHHAEVVTADSGQTDQWQVLAAGIGALFAIFLVLQAAFGSWRLAALGFAALPLALVGGLVAVLLGGGTITIGSVAGLLAVLGIAARQVVVLIRHYQYLQRHAGATFGAEVVLRGTRDCLASTLTSALAIAVVLAPVAVLSGATGFDILGPMVFVVLGGLVTTTLVTLLVVPALYLQLGAVGGQGVPRDLFDDAPERRATEPAPQPAGAVRRSATRVAWPVGILALLGTACGGAVADEYVIENDPGHTEKIKGTHHLKVILEQPAADRLEIATTPVKKAGKNTVVPTTAVFVDTDGQWWVYTNTEPLEYVRHKISVVRQTGSRALLSSGPSAGTEVVTVGVAELYGVEEEVGH